MIDDELVIKFKGGMAEKHKLPAYAAGQTLVGLTRSVMIPMAYLAEGKVRHRKIANEAYQLNLITLRDGSVETVLEVLTNPAAMFFLGSLFGDAAKDVAKDFIKDFISSVIKRCVGKAAARSVEDLEEKQKLPSGDMEALVDAVEPAMREAHATIGNGASNIVIISGDKNIVTLNSSTKAFVMASIEDPDVREKELSIASFNANTGNGRAFDYEIGRTVPFKLDSSVDARSLTDLNRSLLMYTYTRRLGDNRSSRVRVQFSSWNAPDGRVKKLLIYRIRFAD